MTPRPLDVLVVDDSAVMRAMVIRTLRLCGLPVGAVHEAADGAQGLAIAATTRVDAVLADLNMPVMPGDAMVERLRRHPETADVPVLVISTERSTVRIAALQAQGAAFLNKPFSPEQLRDALLHLLGGDDADAHALAGNRDDRDF